MRRIKVYKTAIIIFAVLFLGCVGQLPEEQFDKYVLFTHNGWIEQEAEFTPTNTIQIPVAVSVSGTSFNKENVDISLKYDPTLLARYNVDKFKMQEGLYYSLVPEEAISFTTNLSIPANAESAVTMLTVDFNKITDPYKDYVLPITIESTSKYSLQPRGITESLSHSEVLYNIRRINSFSGNYSGSSTVFKTDNASPPPVGVKYQRKMNDKEVAPGMPVSSKTLYAISNDECYFYAGHIDRNNVNRDKFIVQVRLDENDSLIFSSPNPNLKLDANASIVKMSTTPLVLGTQSTLTTFRRAFANDLRYETVTRELKFCYVFYDVMDGSPVTNANNHILLAEGTFLLEKRELKN